MNRNINQFILAAGALLFLSTDLLAQYNKPNAVAYEKNANAYYVSNSGNGTITKIDSFFNTSNVITGLTNPQDIFFADLGANKAILVLDTNKIKVYDAVTLSAFTTIDVPNAVEIRSGVIDKVNSGVFYLSDVAGGKIIKGVVGPPPFYTFSFSVLASGITRPAGLMFDSKNRLLVVTDTINARILQVNTASGNVTTLKNTSLDKFHSIKEDAQGNYFTTSYGDNALYRFKSDFSDSVKLTTYLQPSGMYINAAQDMLVLCCTGCDKVYYIILHNITPTSTTGICPGDSFSQYLNLSSKEIGTYISNNQFIVELSDSMGSFDKVITLGILVSDKVPQSIRCKLPVGSYGSFHNVRVRATNPAINGSTASFSTNPTPTATAFGKPEVSVCPNKTLKIGMNHTSGFTYKWGGDSVLNAYGISNPSFTGKDSGTFRVWVEVSNTVACHADDTVKILISGALRIVGMEDTVRVCKGDTITIGVTGYNYDFAWNSKRGLSDSLVSNPRAFPDVRSRYVVTFSDTSGACSGMDSVEVLVYQKPMALQLPDSTYFCYGDSVKLTTDPDTNVSFIWFRANGDTLSVTNAITFSDLPGNYLMRLVATSNDRNSCVQRDSIVVRLLSPPQKPVISKVGTDLVSSVNGASYQWYLNGNPLTGTNKSKITASDTGKYTVEVWDNDSCAVLSDPFRYTLGISDFPRMIGISVFPNPATQIIFLKDGTGKLQKSLYYITDIFGRPFLSGNGDIPSGEGIDVSELSSGIYIINITLENRMVSEVRFIKY
jgi:hypothetical protein